MCGLVLIAAKNQNKLASKGKYSPTPTDTLDRPPEEG